MVAEDFYVSEQTKPSVADRLIAAGIGTDFA
jgi:hypothetical protein